MDGFVLPDNKNKQKINNRQKYLNQLLSRLEVDIFGAAETRQQFDMLPSNHGLPCQLDLRKGARCQTSHNKHLRFGPCQQWGTCTTTNEMMRSYVTQQGADDEGLG